MRLDRCKIGFVLACLALTGAMQAKAQGSPGASVRHPSSAFAQVADTYTGLSGASNSLGGRNMSFTAGVDVGLFRVDRFTLSAEGRGTYPLYRGHVDGQKSLLGGIRIDHTFASSKFSRLSIYGNALAGRGEEHYVDGGFPTATLLYTDSSTAVYGAGGGFEIAMGDHLSYKAEVEVQHWNVPFPGIGVIYSKQGSGGVVYRFAGRKVR